VTSVASQLTDSPGLVAIPPVWGEVIHLHLPGYRPSSRARSIGDTAGLCGLGLRPPGTPIADALDWTRRTPTPEDPRPPWRWCRVCVGHLIDLTGLGDQVLRAVLQPPPDAHEPTCPARRFRPPCACPAPPPAPTFADLEMPRVVRDHTHDYRD
jgi:hypothetical protein